MANTLFFPNINGRVFDRLVLELRTAGLETAPPSSFTDGTLRGAAAHGSPMGLIKINYVYSVTAETLTMDVDKPFMIPMGEVKSQMQQAIDTIKDAVFAGQPAPVPPSTQPGRVV